MALSMMTRAYQIAQTSYAAIYEYAYLISVGFFSWAFWGVVPGALSIAGIILIIFAGALIVQAQQGKDPYSG
ncbi:MAG: EamA family transporter, partial [Alphaproteobacteria bacterium]